MDANELRALAEALIECGEDAWPTPPEPIQRAVDYLRAQAKPDPITRAPGPCAICGSNEHQEVCDSPGAYITRTTGCPVHDAAPHPAPAAPQAMEDANVWKQIVPDDEPQAEPKREPLSDERIAEIQRAAYERAAQECIETAAELRRCADGCTDGRYDWKADGALDCADAIRALGRQHD